MKNIALALALSATVAARAWPGPPSISIEMRPGGAGALIARTFHHGTPMALPLTGRAEGLVNGRRVSVTLRFEQDGQTNAFTVPNTWGSDGVWVLNIGVQDDYHSGAGAVVGIDRLGRVAFVRFPTGHFGTRIATSGEVEAMLRTLEAGTA